ncbi:MAG TPA: hypothetical protein ENH84_02580, partial [Phycisphaerae bacterium]|nr:hypothetical protein [Phycisphaerae bacterium]
MRKVLVSLMVLSLVPTLAGAAVTSPDGFEGYALTTNWTPTEPVEGWVISDLFSDIFPFDWKGEIKTSAVSPNSSQVHSVLPRVVGPHDNQGGLVST